MSDQFYVPYVKALGDTLQPAGPITKDRTIIDRLLSDGEIDGYLVGHESVVSRYKSSFDALPEKIEGISSESSISSLPWKEVGRIGKRAYTALMRNGFSTVGRVVDSYERFDGDLPLRGYGKVYDEITRELFSRAGFKLRAPQG